MARSQNWTRNIAKKQRKTGGPLASKGARGIVDGGAVENWKRRAEELGLIVHARTDATRRGKRKRDDEK